MTNLCIFLQIVIICKVVDIYKMIIFYMPFEILNDKLQFKMWLENS
jgi:hypothetical protein